MENRDTITIERSSLYRLGYMIPLSCLFLFWSVKILFAASVISLPGVTVNHFITIIFSDKSGQPYLTGQSEYTDKMLKVDYCLGDNDAQTGCLKFSHNQMIKVTTDDSGVDGVTCHKVQRRSRRCASDEVKDCYDLGDSHWYGGFEAVHQTWPLKKAVPMGEGRILSAEIQGEESNGVELAMGPYVSGDFGIHKLELANVLERMFFSSSGVGIVVSQDSPLYLSLNENKDGKICLAAAYDGSNYISTDRLAPVLEYTVCKADNVREIHDYLKQRFIPKPTATPSHEVFRRPIWSTWAQYNRNISQDTVLEFADKIVSHKLGASQLEIDDVWTVHYGDLEFDPIKFPDPKKMVADLSKRGFPVTLWTHPFISLKSDSFSQAYQSRFLVMMRGSEVPALTKWWNEDMAGLLDVTNPAAVLWYQKKLKNLQEKYNVTSFKFDAGEAHFVPYGHHTFQHMTTTDQYSSLWAELALNSDPISRRQEVRACYRTQKLPLFVRLIDRMSSWDRQDGLLTVIPSILTLGVIGYPFLLPDMIGGNAYADMITFKGGAYPERELYIRWLQLSLFLPALQFSVAPWTYDEEVVSMTRKLLSIREEYIPRILELAEESVTTGYPIIRPLWWVAPLDETALIVEDEYLLGDNVLVAPVVVKGARKRDIYVPPGTWTDKLRGGTIHGPITLRDYSVSLYELAFFERNQ